MCLCHNLSQWMDFLIFGMTVKSLESKSGPFTFPFLSKYSLIPTTYFHFTWDPCLTMIHRYHSIWCNLAPGNLSELINGLAFHSSTTLLRSTYNQQNL